LVLGTCPPPRLAFSSPSRYVFFSPFFRDPCHKAVAERWSFPPGPVPIFPDQLFLLLYLFFLCPLPLFCFLLGPCPLVFFRNIRTAVFFFPFLFQVNPWPYWLFPIFTILFPRVLLRACVGRPPQNPPPPLRWNTCSAGLKFDPKKHGFAGRLPFFFLRNRGPPFCASWVLRCCCFSCALFAPPPHPGIVCPPRFLPYSLWGPAADRLLCFDSIRLAGSWFFLQYPIFSERQYSRFDFPTLGFRPGYPFGVKRFLNLPADVLDILTSRRSSYGVEGLSYPAVSKCSPSACCTPYLPPPKWLSFSRPRPWSRALATVLLCLALPTVFSCPVDRLTFPRCMFCYPESVFFESDSSRLSFATKTLSLILFKPLLHEKSPASPNFFVP